jgi:hypothetical protein
MASSSSTTEQKMEQLQAAVSAEMRDIQELIATMNSRFDELSEDRRSSTKDGSNNKNKGPRITRTGSGTSGSTAPKIAKLDFPKYKGNDDPTSWIYRVEQFFEFHGTNEEDKLPLAAYHLKGDAQLWYQLYKEDDTGEFSWEALKKSLHARYGPTLFEDFFGDLSKLKQMGTVRDYQIQFERLLSRVGRLAPDHQLGCFISGLKETIRTEVQAARPTNLSAAVGMARLYEAKHQAQRRPTLTDNRRSPNEPPMPSSALTRGRTTQIKRLTAEEVKERREKGLCFNCDEKFVPGHRCAKLFWLEVLAAEEEPPLDHSLDEEEEGETPAISLHAISGIARATHDENQGVGWAEQGGATGGQWEHPQFHQPNRGKESWVDSIG